MITIVPQVDSVECAKLRTTPPFFVITATGTVPTTGWENGALAPVAYVHPPADGIQDFTFYATAPQFGATIPRPINAHWIGLLPEWAKGVRVQAGSNAVESDCGGADFEPFFHQRPGQAPESLKHRDGATPLWPVQVMGGEIPWPL